MTEAAGDTQHPERQIKIARAWLKERTEARRHALETERLYWLEQVRRAVAEIAPDHPEVQRVWLYGSICRPGCFGPHSDIDLAVECQSLEAESRFWRALEQRLGRDCDVRPLVEPIRSEVQRYGALIYERTDCGPDRQHP
ncbi:nucleotidyltransferase domain-containing protein [Litorilinea aerophila]|uniref:Nucleotidyltransferase domain-containing protein n=1 Tax=Litorilinea aerophila TaxID=1204385 RepID=A0A540VDH6_9CHLR|nr:nucleotidyltransferase domain-containing protein [Litorilinea aerophila]MCC9077498.1 nucleotidyltransferase domain-containing protein [Litorilinea aerophila]OUC06283.1 hypothetical protein RY27_22000 [Litorilinea aerophila]